jgi:hypothetical protein
VVKAHESASTPAITEIIGGTSYIFDSNNCVLGSQCLEALALWDKNVLQHGSGFNASASN